METYRMVISCISNW